ncbi:MAG: ATP-binding cassette domain-containing protein [Actinomycetota bacterium]
MTTDELFSLSGVHFQYQKSLPTLVDINFALHTGVNLGIVGESGSGKSTILKLLLGLLTPSSGEVRFIGESLNAKNRKQEKVLRRKVQVIFQDPYSSLDPSQKVGALVAEPLKSLGLVDEQAELSSASDKKEWTREQVESALNSVDLPSDTQSRFPHQFSGGQRQRIAIARAIVANPQVLLADEPVSSLDVTSRELILELLKDLQKSRGLTIAVVSHDLSTIAALCQETLVLQGGKVIEQGSTRQILSNPTTEYTTSLMKAIPRLPR